MGECVKAAVSAECARVFIVANPDSGGGAHVGRAGGGGGGGDRGRDERYLVGGEGGGTGGVAGVVGGEGGGVGGGVGGGGGGGDGGGVGSESGPSREALFASPGAGYDDGRALQSFPFQLNLAVLSVKPLAVIPRRYLSYLDTGAIERPWMSASRSRSSASTAASPRTRCARGGCRT